jgi:DNA-binding IclR family transcriptional regulator
MGDPAKSAVRRRGIQSVGIGLGVLDALTSLDGPAPLGAISIACGLSLSQTHRYLASLVEAGMARQDAESGRYELGPAALRLGLSALSKVDAFDAANQGLTRFSRETGRTVQIAALGPSGPIVVRWVMGSPPVATSLQVGAPLPMLRSATGHIFLAFRPQAQTQAIVERETQAARGLKPVDVEGLRAAVRAAGYSAIDQNFIPGLRATAMPIFDFQGEAILAAAVVASDAFDPAGDAGIRERLAKTCREISASIGGPGAHG